MATAALTGDERKKYWLGIKKEFLDFCADLPVETKEEGIVRLGRKLLGTQRYFIDQVFDGLGYGIHYFVILKGRQIGISTITIALDLYWHFKFAGTQGTLATDDESNREMFRTTITNYIDGLPEGWKQPVDPNNRTQIGFKNRSRLIYQVAGTRKNVGFGAGKALSYVHATEVGKWGEGTDLSSFQASLAQTNPKRLYIWESTAYGMATQFNQMWESAEIAIAQRAVFIGWWRNEKYRVETGSEIYQVYWDGTLTTEESSWVKEVKELYDFEIDAEQIAWHRWMLNETMGGDEQQMHEKYPPTAEYAFIMSGSQFFSVQRLTDVIKIVKKKPYETKRFVFGAAFDDTELVDSNEKTATLKIWQMPVKGGQYLVGGDPAWGSSEWADRFALNVSRCWADGVEQVAEFCTPELNTMQFAWVMLYLAGAYGDPSLGANVMINLELNGPGMAVWNEVQSLKMRAQMTGGNSNLAHLLNNINNFLYSRPDAVRGGLAYHTKSTQAEKERMLNLMKDHHEFGTLTINSVELLNEMKNVVRDGGVIGAPGRGKDDRVIAQALNMLSWNDRVRMPLIQRGITKKRQAEAENAGAASQVAGRSVDTYLKNLGMKMKARA